MLPVEKDDGVRALFDKVQDELIATAVDDAVLTVVVVDRAGGDLEQLAGHHCAIDGGNGGLLELHDVEVLHVVVLGVVLLAQLERHGVLVVLRNVDAVLEAMSDGDVTDHGGHRCLDAGAVVPLDHAGLRADLLRDTRGRAKAEEALAETHAVVEQEDLVPEVTDAVAVRRASQQPAVLEVLGDLGDGLGALASVMLERGAVMN